MSRILSLKEISFQIKELCEKRGRDPTLVKILAVSKRQPLEKIKDLFSLGQMDFGENYVQELKEKQALFSEPAPRWHLIGHLQKNKVKAVIGNCFLIHSVDSIELAEEIHKRALTHGVRQKILLQVNVAGENSKEGFEPDLLQKQIKNIFLFSHLEILGLMTMPPFVENPEANRIYFRRLKDLLLQLRSENNLPASFSELSMGTSQDYPAAIEEGATWIRLGSTIFGARA